MKFSKVESNATIMFKKEIIYLKIFKFLNYEDYLNIITLNKISQEFVQSFLNINLIKNINKKYFKRIFQSLENKDDKKIEVKKLTFKEFEIILDSILKKENDLDLKILFKHCAYLLSKMIFTKEINISQIKSLSVIINTFKYFKELNFNKSLNSIQIGANVFHEDYNNNLIKDLINLNLSRRIQTLNIYENPISDNTLDLITKFVKTSSSLKNLTLNEVGIGGSYNSINFLQVLAEKENLVSIDLSYNKFTSEVVGCIKQIMNKEKSDLKEFKLEYNEFIKTDIVNIISDFLPKENRTVTVQFEESPVYSIKDNVDIHIDEEIDFSQQNFMKTYASSNLKIQGVVLKRLDDLNSNAQKILSELILSPTITDAYLFLNNHKVRVVSFYLDLIADPKFTHITLDGLEEDENQNREDNTKKVLERIMKITHLKYFGLNSLPYNNEWFKMFLNILDNNKLERVCLTDLQKIDFKGISQLSMSLELNRYLKRVDIFKCFLMNTRVYVADCVKENKNIECLFIDEKKYK
jgi:hypothetical protein